MRYFLFFMFLGLIFVQPAAAQDAPNRILLEEEEKPKTSAEEIEEMLGDEKEKEKALQSVYQYANEHYDRCIKVRHHVLHGKNLKMMCSCVSANMSEVMTLEQIAEISKGTEEGQLQLGRMLMFVYHPCIKAPIYNTITDQCLGSQKNRYMMKNQRATCHCLADYVSTKMNEVAPHHIEGAVLNKSKKVDPIDLLIPAYDYEMKFKHYTGVCIKKFELGYH